MQCCSAVRRARLLIHNLSYCRHRVDNFLDDSVIKCKLTHRRSVVTLCMLCMIRSNLMHPHCGASAGRSSVFLRASSMQDLIALYDLYTSFLQHLSGTISVTLCLRVLDRRALRARSILLFWPKLLSPFYRF